MADQQAPTTPAAPPAFTFAGTIGTPFNIDAAAAVFGTEEGTVQIDGQSAEVTSWRPNRVKGVVPKGLTPGEKAVVVTTMKAAGEGDARQVTADKTLSVKIKFR